MSDGAREISALPVVGPLAVVSFLVLLQVVRARGAVTLARVATIAVTAGYVAGVVANTVFPIYLGRVGVHPSWTVFLNLVPLANTDLRDMLQNVVVFVPLGILLPLVAPVRTVGRVLVVGFLLSLTMELLQLGNAVTGHGGHVADVNDLLANTLGAPLGYGIYRLTLRVPMLARLAESATMSPPGPTVEP